MQTKLFRFLGIIILAGAIVAMGAHEFSSKHAKVASKIDDMEVRKMLKTFKADSEFERASFSPEAYQQMKKEQEASTNRSKFELDLTRAKSWLRKTFLRKDTQVEGSARE